MSNESDEYRQHLHSQLRLLQEQYAKAAEPIFRELVRLQSMSTKVTMMLRPEDLDAMLTIKQGDAI